MPWLGADHGPPDPNPDEEATTAKRLQLRDHDARPYVRERGAALRRSPRGNDLSGWPSRPDEARATPENRYLADLYQASGTQGLIAHPQGGPRRPL